MELRRTLRAIRRHVWVVVALPLAAATAAAALTELQAPVYQAEAVVLVRPAQPISSLDPNANAVSADQVASTYSQLMTQRTLLARVVADLGLKMTPEQLSRSVSVAPRSNTTLLQVSARSTSPALARDIANKVVDDFIAQSKDIQQTLVNQYAARMQSQLDPLRSQILREQSRIDQLQAAAAAAALKTSLPPQDESRALPAQQQTELSNLQQQVIADRTQYSQIVSSESAIALNVARSTDSVIVISPAVLPGSPVSPVPAMNVGLALLGGLVVALGLALLLDHLDQTIKSDAELTERTGLTPLTHVPLGSRPGRSRGIVVPGGDPAVAEPYKTLRTNVLFTTLDRRRSTIAVTSAAPEEGKSVVSANFAAALAAAGHRTLLLDCDFRRPSQHRLFGRIKNVGVSDLLLGEVGEADAALPVNRLPNLWLMTSGRIPPNPSELLSSERMRDLLRRLQQRFAYVVVDTPPVNAVADPLIIGSYADGTLFVVEQRRTTFAAARTAVQSLERVGAHVLGAVVNKVGRPESYYAYQQYYGYGSNGEANGDRPVDDPVAVGGGATPQAGA